MKRVRPILLLSVVLAGCSQHSHPDLFKMGELNGRFFCIEGDGCTIELTMTADGHYDAVWHGCLGIYGRANGIWRVNDHQVNFSPAEETGDMQGHLRSLCIRRFLDEPVMVKRDSEEVVEKLVKLQGKVPIKFCYRKSEVFERRKATNNVVLPTNSVSQ